jgi:hypothetical protein
MQTSQSYIFCILQHFVTKFAILLISLFSFQLLCLIPFSLLRLKFSLTSKLSIRLSHAMRPGLVNCVSTSLNSLPRFVPSVFPAWFATQKWWKRTGRMAWVRLIHPFGNYVTLAIEPRFRVSDLVKDQHLKHESEAVEVTCYLPGLRLSLKAISRKVRINLCQVLTQLSSSHSSPVSRQLSCLPRSTRAKIDKLRGPMYNGQWSAACGEIPSCFSMVSCEWKIECFCLFLRFNDVMF